MVAKKRTKKVVEAEVDEPEKEPVKKPKITIKDAEDREWLWVSATNDRDRWNLSHIPEGEWCAPHIKRSSKNTDGSFTYFVYRNGRYIDCENELENAKKIAKTGKMRPERIASMAKMRNYLENTPGDPVEFAKLSEQQRQLIVDGYHWATPKKAEAEKRGIKVQRTVHTNDMTKQERKGRELPADSIIKCLKRKNPKKENTDAWVRWELLFQHDGKTIGEFIAAHGNPTTLKNAIKAGYVSAEGV